MIYGGPMSHEVTDAWKPRLLWQHLADRGFFVWQLDNRGTAGHGHDFEAATHRRLGEVEIADQLAGVEFLAGLDGVDPDRIGIYGHSYGGFLAALAMLRSPERFRAGVASSPVTRWDLYDSGYTERYMETPTANPDGYRRSDLGRLASALRGRLFLVHGLMDENVHFAHTAHLIDALTQAGKRFDLLVLPGARHGLGNASSRAYVVRRVVEFLVESL